MQDGLGTAAVGVLVAVFVELDQGSGALEVVFAERVWGAVVKLK